MSEQWYCSKDGQEYGPYTRHQIQELISLNGLLPTDLVREESMATWVKVRDADIFPPGIARPSCLEAPTNDFSTTDAPPPRSPAAAVGVPQNTTAPEDENVEIMFFLACPVVGITTGLVMCLFFGGFWSMTIFGAIFGTVAAVVFLIRVSQSYRPSLQRLGRVGGVIALALFALWCLGIAGGTRAEHPSKMKQASEHNEGPRLTEQTPQRPVEEAKSPSVPTALTLTNQPGKWGFIDKSGRLIIACQFDDVHKLTGPDLSIRFARGLAEVCKDRKWGFVDRSGTLAIACQFDDAWSFSDGFAPVSRDGHWGFVDRKGQVVIDFRYESAEPFEEGLAPVRLDKRCGFIDKSGKVVIGFLFDRVNGFHEGRCAVRVGKHSDSDYGWHEGWGFIDKLGKMVVTPTFTLVGNFREGSAWVQKGEAGDASCTFGLIDPQGNYLVPLQTKYAYIELEKDPERIEVLGSALSGSGYMNRKGNWLIEPRYGMIGLFCEGLASVTEPGTMSNYGYIDESGKLVIPYRFDWAGSFANGLAPVQVNGVWGYIDRTGKTVIVPQY